MNISRRMLMQLGLAGAGTSLLYGSGPAFSQSGPTKGGTAVIGLVNEPPALTSAFISDNAATYITPKIFDALISYDMDFKPVPQLATEWAVSEDGLTYTWKLRPGVTWHDGTPFTSADVAFSLMNIWKVHSARGKVLFANVESVETPDDLTVIWKLSTPAPHMMVGLVSFFVQLMPKHIYEGTDFLKNPANVAPVGTGPFKLGEWVRGEYVRLVRNEAYWNAGMPYLDELIFRFMPDAASRSAGLEAEEILLVGESALPAVDFKRLAEVPALEVSTAGYAYLGTVHLLGFNLDADYVKDVKVRQAINHAIDRQFLIDNVWLGFAKASTGPLPASMTTYYSPDVPLYPFDMAKAAALLDEAGYPAGADGKRFSLTFLPIPNVNDIRTAEYVRDTLGRLGIAVEIVTLDSGAYNKRVWTDRAFSMYISAPSMGPDPTIGTQRFYYGPSFKVGAPNTNGAHYANLEVDAIFDEASRTADMERRKELFAQFQKIAQTDLPYLPLVDVLQVTVSNRRLKNHTVSVDGVKANWHSAYLAES